MKEMTDIHMNEMVEMLQEKLRNAGIKVTHQRLEIFLEVLRAYDHPDADKVFKNVRKRLPTVSLDTVYRTLWLLVEMGILQALGNSREKTRFDVNLDKHHHFTCRLCGEVFDFHNQELSCLNILPVLPDIGKVEQITIEIRGICESCMKKQDQISKKGVSE